jgi:hypothetical protein
MSNTPSDHNAVFAEFIYLCIKCRIPKEKVKDFCLSMLDVISEERHPLSEERWKEKENAKDSS